VSRLTDAGADRLTARLSSNTSTLGERSAQISGASPADSTRQLTALFADGPRLDALGRAMTLELAEYLKRPVRCTASANAPALPQAWRYQSAMEGVTLWVDVDPELAAAFADAMIGGDGAGAPRHGRRAALVALSAVARMLSAIAQAAALEGPTHIDWLGAANDPKTVAIGGGRCAVATNALTWRIGAGIGRHAVVERLAPMAAFARPAAPSDDPDAIVHAAVTAMCARMQQLLRSQIVVESEVVTKVESGEHVPMKAVALRLALTSGGNGALVASLDGPAVTAIGCGLVSSFLPRSDRTGDIVLSAAEAIARDGLREAAARLPGTRDGGHRIVRLADAPLPARTAHHVVTLRISVAGAAGNPADVSSVRAAIAAAVAWLTRRTRPRAMCVVDQLPLYGGGCLHLIDVDDRRLIVASTPHAIRLLTHYERPSGDENRKDAARLRR
jgi:Flagellar biosynthesis protein, FliO